MNDNDFSKCAESPLCGSARQVVDECLSVMGKYGIPDGMETHLVEYMQGLQDWVPPLMKPMPYQSPDLERSFYDCFMRHFIAKAVELSGNSPKVAVTSPYLAKNFLIDYDKGAKAMERLHWKLSSTSYGTPFSVSQRKRAAAALDVEQVLLTNFLRSILPPTHYNALEKLGINAVEWREKHNAGLAHGLSKHRKAIVTKRTLLSEGFRTDHREGSEADAAFVQNLAAIWRAGFRVEPTVSHNRDHDTESLFCSFVGAAWKVATGTDGPSADSIRRALKKQQITDKI